MSTTVRPAQRQNFTPRHMRSMIDAAKLRRAAIASLMAGNLTIPEIQAELAKQGIVNPVTGRRWSHISVIRDMERIRHDWYIQSEKPTPELKAEQLGKLRASQRRAWENKDNKAYLAALKLEMELTGTLKPVNVTINFSMDVMMEFNKILQVTGMNGDQILLALMDQLKTNVPQLAEGA